MRARYQEILEQPTFLAWLRQKVHQGTASDQLLALLHHYAYGRPVQAVDLGVTFDPMRHLAHLARQATEQT